ncbi:hypothetical protein SteCoe_26949 [Stentor coeruleus]|uniref:PPM-type phosphatase domain-containing protein n=1 Tax=Stentor coeruleus TaxID=5963 RepID=A0A1R2BBQ6_9CILI|nr:hypothetical protein SteCoe_26949 [Stentor coeruleus]
MNTDISARLSNLTLNSQFQSANSLKSARRPMPVISFTPDIQDKHIGGLKKKSTKGWVDWSGESSPVDNFGALGNIKLPPMNIEIHRSSLVDLKQGSQSKSMPQMTLPTKTRVRGSVLLEEPLSLPKPQEKFRARGSILLDPLSANALNINKQSESSESSESEPEKPIKKKIQASKSIKIQPSGRESILNQNLIPNYVTRCGYKTHVGSVMGKKKKHNQDNWLISQRLQGLKGQYLFAVCDGHGDKGHKVSSLIREQLPLSIENSLSSSETPDSNLEDLITSGIQNAVSSIENSDIDLKFSGSTLVAVLIRGPKIICANIGDSRAVLGTCDRSGNWQAIELSNDHKPFRPDEAKRINMAGGIVRQFQTINGELVGPLRVWSTDRDIPGLAMTRSIGDLASRKSGIISDPEIVIRNIQAEDKFLVLATDGIWEFISSQEAVDIVKDVWAYGKSEACCEKLLETARKRWQKESVVDDITVLVAFLHNGSTGHKNNN